MNCAVLYANKNPGNAQALAAGCGRNRATRAAPDQLRADTGLELIAAWRHALSRQFFFSMPRSGETKPTGRIDARRGIDETVLDCSRMP
jgi:hypothetical protein